MRDKPENSDWIHISKDPVHVKRERAKARELRRSDWWKRQIEAGICHYCGRKFQPAELTLDHILPLARGGKSTKGNCVPCCKACNNEKKHLTPAEQIMREMEDESSTGREG